MPKRTPLVVEIKNVAHVGSARRAVHNFAGEIGFTETELAELDIVAQEIGTNAVNYSMNGGQLVIATPYGQENAVELLYLDSGPGIYDLEAALNDGVSTSGSLGTGLGAIKRLMDEFDIYSTTSETRGLSVSNTRRTTHGTALLARKWLHGAEAGETHPDKLNVGVISRPHPGEEVNGDGYYIAEVGDNALVSVIDGLGHGQGAFEATQAALDILEQWDGEPLDSVLAAANDALKATRGAVMGVGLINRRAGELQFAGVGNIDAHIFNGPSHLSPVSVYGTLGGRFGQPRIWKSEWTADSTMIVTSDGLSSSWSIDSYPDLMRHTPQLIAGVLMRDMARESDDATVLVIR